jgi:hypothetical protein
MTIECESALSDLVLQAARDAVASPIGQAYRRGGTRPSSSPLNAPLVPLLEALLDAADAVAAAIADNAWDESRPMDADWTREIRGQAQKLATVIHSASTCPDRTKELV